MDKIAYLPRGLQKLPDTKLFSTPHVAFAKYTQTQSGIKQQVHTDMHCLVIVLCGEKIMHTKSGDFVIRANEGLFLQADNYCLSNITALDIGAASDTHQASNPRYEALLLFFDNVSLFEFVSKHKERLHFHSLAQGSEVFHLRDSDMLSTITKSFEFYIQEFREELLPFVSHKFEELFLHLSVQYARVFTSFVQQIMQGFALDSHLAFLYCQKEFDNVAQMAEYAKTDQATFSRKFKQVFGLSPKHWLDERRFEKAKFLLEYSSKNINEICMECGFGSSSWFIERFKNRYHCTPKHYQKSKNLYFA